MRSWKQRLCSLLLCGAMLASLCTTALAENVSIPYLDETGTEKFCEKYSDTTGLIWNSGWYVAQGGGQSPGRIIVTGEVHLILANGCELNAEMGIEVSEGNSLTIYAQSKDESTVGKLKAHGGGENAGIGGRTDGGCGEITINGGTVEATSTGGAGIGGGYGGEGGNITINGGNVTATSRDGAGIGGGYGGIGGNITINGGNVTAKGCAGIGGGRGSSGGNITINEGNVTADGSNGGAGIGGGYEGIGGNIAINGGDVTASGGGTHLGGAGIGSGYGGEGGTITISGGTVKATSTLDAGIGGGSGGKITINDGTVTATSGGYGAGIGGGYGGDGGEITISGGDVTAFGNSGAGVGGGAGGSGGKITINDGTVTATSKGFGAGIGGGESGAGGEITISGGTVEASSTSGADIGGGRNSVGDGIAPSDKIEIREGTVTGPDGAKPNIGPVHGAKTGEWASDSTGHWHPCEIENCTENHQFDKGSHSFGDWTIDTPATSTTAGSKHQDCGICQYRETQTIPPVHSHSYGQEWKSDADGHWHECSCGDKSGYAAHSFGDWTIDTPATSATAGSKHRVCGNCQYRETQAIPATGGGNSGGSSWGSGGYVPPTYRPDVTQPSQGGSVSVSPSSPQRGDTVTVTPRPDAGYELDSIAVTDRDGKSVEVTARLNGTYTFQQPSGRVKIEVTFKPIETPWSSPFADVGEGAWYYEAVRFVQEQGLMNGCSDGRFAPEDTLSRSQLAQILFNKEGRPGVNYLLDFSDLADDAWYTEAVRWAASQGIVSGYGDGTFGPDDPITREQLAVMLWRYSGSPAATDKELDFNDTDEISGYALEALRWAVENGILNGDGGGGIGPQDQATRAQAAQMLKNFFEEENA